MTHWNDRRGEDWMSTQRMAPALILIGIGALFLLNNLHILPVQNAWEFWPVILMVIGAFKLADSGTQQGRISGLVLLGAGGLFLANNLGLLDFNVWDLWPLLLIGAGILMLLNRMDWPLDVCARVIGDSGIPHETAIFGGGKRRFNEDFKGGKYEAICGGFELDLRKAYMSAESAELEISAVFGGAEVKVPENWSVVVKGAGIFGGYVDNTRQPDPATTPNFRRLYVKGGAVFGGVEIKN
jgi:hypothetical protein